jgi:TonB family protein
VAATADIWTEQDPLKTPLWVSVALHAGIFAALIFGGIFHAPGENWGGAAGGEGGAISVSMVASIPLPSHERTQNILANESKGLSQTVPKQQEEAPEAIPIPAPNAKKAPKQHTLQQPKTQPQPVEQAANTVPFGQGGQAGNMYSTASIANGTLGVGTPGSDFGSKYSSYVDSVRRRISETWAMYQVDPSATGRRVWVSFDILRDGSHSKAQIVSGSDVPTLDRSAIQTLDRIDRFAPLPYDYRGQYVSVEFYFEYSGKH